MEQQYSIEQVLNAKIHEKATRTIGELSAKLFEAEAKAELLQELYNQSQQELDALKAEKEAANEGKKNDTPAKETGSTPPSTKVKSGDDTRDWFDINDNDGKKD